MYLPKYLINCNLWVNISDKTSRSRLTIPLTAAATARADFGSVAGPIGGLVRAEAGDRDGRLAGGALHGPRLYPRANSLPRRRGLPRILDLDFDKVVTRRRALVAAGLQRPIAHL